MQEDIVGIVGTTHNTQQPASWFCNQVSEKVEEGEGRGLSQEEEEEGKKKKKKKTRKEE